MPQWHILDSSSVKSRDSILHQLKLEPEALTVALSVRSLSLIHINVSISLVPSPSIWFSASLSMGSPFVMASSSSKLPLCRDQMVSKHLQLCRKLIADNVSFPKSSSKIPWGGLME